MTTTTAWLPAQNYSRLVSGVATVDAGETATLAIPCGGRAVVRLGVPALTVGTLTFTVQPYPGATFRTLKDATGATVTVASSTGGFVVDIPELAGAFAFTIVCGGVQASARAFQVQCVGDVPALALTATAVAATAQWTTVPNAIADVSAGAHGWTTGHSPVTLYTVTGSVLARVFGVVGATQLTSTAGTGTASVGVAGAVQAFLPTTTVNGTTNFIAGAAWVDATPTLTAEALPNTGNWIVLTGDIIATIVTNSLTAGALTLFCQYIPLTDGASVVAV